MDHRNQYPSDLTDGQWQKIEPLIPAAKPGGRPREVEMREVFNGIFYLLRSGYSWRMLPRDLPPWGTVHYYYRCFRLAGLWPKMNDALREQVRVQATRRDKKREPRQPCLFLQCSTQSTFFVARISDTRIFSPYRPAIIATKRGSRSVIEAVIGSCRLYRSPCASVENKLWTSFRRGLLFGFGYGYGRASAYAKQVAALAAGLT